MGSSPKPPPIPPMSSAAVEIPPPPMQESPYAQGSEARKNAQAMAAGIGMGGTLISRRAASTEDPHNAMGKTLLGA